MIKGFDSMVLFFTSLAFISLAEMGDKTQLLAMTLATRFPWKTVLWGVFCATLANHLLAVIAGNILPQVIPLTYVKIAAAASFIGFGLWTLRGDCLKDEANCYFYSPFWTTAIAFFLAEMGDKTQLATLALAADYQSLLPVWLGTTGGMIVADSIAIGVGVVLKKKIPERAVKWFAAIIFIGFGVWGLYEELTQSFLVQSSGVLLIAQTLDFLLALG